MPPRIENGARERQNDGERTLVTAVPAHPCVFGVDKDEDVRQGTERRQPRDLLERNPGATDVREGCVHLNRSSPGIPAHAPEEKSGSWRRAARPPDLRSG